MYKYRISKYNPLFRDKLGRYQKSEWTAISDIGKKFDAGYLTGNDYVKIEDCYVTAVQQIMNYHSLSSLCIDKLSRSFPYEEFLKLTNDYSHLYSENLLNFYLKFNGNEAAFEEVGQLIRLQLREDVWVEMFSPKKLKIFIGYDYLMGVHSSRPLDKIIPKIKDLGLYVETN